MYFNLISTSHVNVTELTLSFQSSSVPFTRVNGVFTTTCELQSHHLHLDYLRCGGTKIIMTLLHNYNTAEAEAVAVAVAVAQVLQPQPQLLFFSITVTVTICCCCCFF